MLCTNTCRTLTLTRPRYKSPPPSPPPMLCKNTCDNPFGNGGPKFIGNGHCQDGHADAEGAQCDLGTDCDDCGPRYYLPPSPPPPAPLIYY